MNDLIPDEFVAPPAWSLTLGIVGRILILVSAGVFSVSGLSWLLSHRWKRLEPIGKIGFNCACAGLVGAFVVLGVLFATNRFEFEYVYGHADTHNALAYRIAGIWSGQEGSFLLWATASAIFALATVGRTGAYRRWYTVAYSFFLGGVASILAFESPFRLNLFEGKPFVPIEGMGLAPSLQNYWVIIHPPTIFLGFGSLTALFALAFAALATKDYESWIPVVRPWAIVSVTLVGLGLCMGGFWAYETLGWGGFWMWDPVENVSFVPWCFAAAFVHGVIVQVTRKKWQMSNMLFGALPFLVFVYGTFLTRSGFLSDASVHSFAEMDRSALKLLIVIMAGTTLGFSGLWCFRALQQRKLAVAAEKSPSLSREAFYTFAIMALLMMGAATMVGMSVPLIQALKGQKASVVEEAMYHQVLPWIFIPIMLLMAVTPFVAWRGMAAKELAAKVYSILCVTVAFTGLALFLCVVTPFGKRIQLAPEVTMLGKFHVNGLAWITALVGICLFVIVANGWRLAEILKRSKMGTAPFLAHIGVAILMTGLIVSRGFEQKARSIVMADHPGRLLDYEVRYRGMTLKDTNRDNRLLLDVYSAHGKGELLFTASPGLYKTKMAGGKDATMVWPHIERGLLMDTYISLGQPQTDASGEVTVPMGETANFGGLAFTYDKMTRQGEFGQKGAKFGAEVTVRGGGRSATLKPSLELGDGGAMIEHPVELDKNMQLAMVRMNASDKSITLRVQLTTPVYPIEIYHKPMTILVWLGSAVLTISGLLAAYYRRTVRVAQVQKSSIPATKPARLERVPVTQGNKP